MTSPQARRPGALRSALATLRRRWLWVLAALLVFLWLSRRAADVALGPDATWSQVHESKVLRVGMDASYPPFEWIDAEGRFQGLDVALAEALAARWDVEAQCFDVHFDGLYDALRTDKFDVIISALPHDRMLTRDVLYSHSYLNAGQVLLARTDAPPIASLEDLDGRRVAVELGAQAHQLARQLARDRGLSLEIVARQESNEVLAALAEGAADAVICDRVTAYAYMQQAPLVQVGPPLTDEPLVIAARLDATTTIREINAALAEWSQDGTLEGFKRRWFQDSF